MRTFAALAVTAVLAVAARPVRAECTEAQGKLSVEQALTALHAVCDGGEAISRCADPKRNRFTGCTRCPAWAGGGGGPFSLESATPGHFTAPGANEMLVDFAGCGAAASGGGSVLLRRDAGGGWQRVSWAPGLRTFECDTVGAQDRTDRAVCASVRRTGNDTLRQIEVIDLRHGKPERTPLFEYLASAGAGGCETGHELYSTGERINLADTNGDGHPDLVIQIDATTATVASGATGGTCLADESTRRSQQFQFVFLFDGRNFYPAPGAQDALRRLREFHR